MDIKEEFKDEFYKTCEMIRENYSTKDEEEGEILGTIIIQLLHEVQHDTEKMSFIEFYKKHLKGTLYLGCEDFTATEIKYIIDESPLTERDKTIALTYWVDLMSEDDIAYKVGCDKKTIRNNVPKISMILKTTAAKIYSKAK